mgnify:CR=1 FL=1
MTTRRFWARPSRVLLSPAGFSAPKLIGRLDMSPPFKGGATSGHGVLKIPGKPLLFANSEAGGGAGGCTEPLNYAAMIDIKDPAKPRFVGRDRRQP